MDDKRLATWQALQERAVVNYRAAYAETGSYLGYFSIPEYESAVKAGKVIAATCSRCLDVGCGILARPSYMQPHVEFVGIDPFEGERPREFEFHQGVGEQLPFPDESFPCVSFMSSLDHQVDPLASLHEAARVLKPHGHLYLWERLVRHPALLERYHWWKVQPPGTLFNEQHQHAFMRADIEALFQQTGFQWLKIDYYPFSHQFPATQLITGMKI